MSPKDWTLLAINAAEGRTLSPVQLQKALFLLGRQLQEETGPNFYQFRPYDYGPFCADIYRDAEALEREGLVKATGTLGQRWVEYAVTADGANVASEIEASAPRRAAQYLRQIVTWAKSLSFGDLVRAIYRQYPEFREHSVFQG